MNVIFILIDSLNRRFLAPYGGDPAIAPNLARFAEKALRFDNHYVGSLPCMPARRELFTGRKEFLWRPWGHLEAFDRPLPRLAANAGYTTQIVTDHYHYWEEPAHGYLESYQGMEIIRGHEIDPWKTDPITSLPEWVDSIEKWRPEMAKRYYRNVKEFKTEEDFFPAKVFNAASDWLDSNHAGPPFLLHVESFDVHEPFHVPEPYRSMWTSNVSDRFTCWPPYQDLEQEAKFLAQTSPEELDFIRGQYTAKVTMMDKWLGSFLDRVESLGLFENTAVIITTDHGHDLGEYGRFGKQFPDRDSHANIPLLIRHPAFSSSRSTQAMTSTVDLYATMLELMQIEHGPSPHSRSLVPVIEDPSRHLRDAVLFGHFGAGCSMSDGEHLLMQGYDNRGADLNIYTGRLAHSGVPGAKVESGCFIPDVDLPVWRIPTGWGDSMGSTLVRRGEPLGVQINLIETDPQLARRMRDRMIALMEEEGCPPEQYARLGLKRD